MRKASDRRHRLFVPMRRGALGLALLLGAAPAPLVAQEPHGTHGPRGSARDGGVPLYDNLGSFHYQISTRVPRAQAYFDQGLRLTFAFNHAEAIEAFEEAARIDPDCAMCYWGIAFALGPNINLPMPEEAAAPAYKAVRRAAALSGKASDVERALIQALTHRYAKDPKANRAALDSAYARAMGEVASRWPGDATIATLHADALMNLSPWYYFESADKPRPATRTILARLEGALRRDPDHPGACHLYIHAVEQYHPQKAVACAERLAALMPGAGHIVHMPGHIYIRVGRYNDALQANVHATRTDEVYIADRRPNSFYVVSYYPHNYHFLSLAAKLAGRSVVAIDAARTTVENVTLEMAAQYRDVERMVPYLSLTLATFGRWDEVLAEPLPPANLPLATGLAQYARGMAFAGKGDLAAARAALAEVERAGKAGVELPFGPALDIAREVLSAEIAAKQGRTDEAIRRLRAAVAIEDGLVYMEPPYWHMPVRHLLGAQLLQAGRPAEAERVYREDLERFPENGWSLFGLMKSLEAQGKKRQAAQVKQRFDAAWAYADVVLTASRF